MAGLEKIFLKAGSFALQGAGVVGGYIGLTNPGQGAMLGGSLISIGAGTALGLVSDYFD